jgi:phosphate transport system substrate-binding protein
VEDSLTSGRITIVCAPEAYRLVERERAAFQTLYPRAKIGIRLGSSREAVAALFAASADIAVITRELEPEERRAAVQGKLALDGFRFARGGVLAVIHPSNPVENLAIDDLRRIYRNEVTRWSQLGGPSLAIVPVIQPVESDITEFFSQAVMGLEPIRARVVYEESDSAVAARVASEPGAIGYVSLGVPLEGVQALRLASLTGLPYWKPDLEAIYRGDYPLTRFFSMYVRATGPKLANGFITFATSFEGQKLVRDFGLVPTEVPVRFVRRSPMLSTH